MKTIVVFILAFFVSGVAWSQTLLDAAQGEQWIQLKNGHKLYVEYTAPQSGYPTLIFVNGLTYSTKDYSALSERLQEMGYGTLLYDAYGMGKTLLANPLPTAPIDYEDQIEDLNELLEAQNVPKPYNFVGLSYGGGILIGYGVRYPENVNKLFLMSPYTEVIESSKNIILKQIEWVRIFFPYNDATDEELANFFIRMFAYQNYPIFEPTVLENPYKLEGVIRLTQGITPYRPVDEAHKLPKHTLYLMTGILDQYVTHSVYDSFWQAAQAGEEQCSFLTVGFAEHKLSQAVPGFISRWIHASFKGDYCQGHKYIANPYLDYFISDEGKGFILPDYDEE